MNNILYRYDKHSTMSVVGYLKHEQIDDFNPPAIVFKQIGYIESYGRSRDEFSFSGMPEEEFTHLSDIKDYDLVELDKERSSVVIETLWSIHNDKMKEARDIMELIALIETPKE